MARPSPQTDRVVAVVDLLTSHPAQPFTLAEVSRRLGVNKSTCYSMLSTLTEARWLLRDPRRKTYRLGPALIAASRAAAQRFPALELAQPVMVELSNALGVNCLALAVEDDHVTLVDQVRHLRAAGPPVHGGDIPLRVPFGSAVLAWTGPDRVDRWLADAPAGDVEHYREVLTITRRRGYSVELATSVESQVRQLMTRIDDIEGVTLDALADRLAHHLDDGRDFVPVDLEPDRRHPVASLGSPVLDHDGAPVLVLSLTGFPELLTGRAVDDAGRRLAAATATVSAAMGGTT